ncbi:MAG: acetyl-CoA carboxylase biotin carboxyl carrier protein subunit [Chloroflexi bacterium AL-W]|nr:acetyl-CoA carboxylase biotin carboxyl carrier protein subunit [Chloroflexi bacterium AL-N1]NOK66216.1 acetyl-CoA carboxylase biotin carboxyl carrier protein subunit [Chloroflexi bacterium AL-N10]NOK73097.1 acetyl-CoA carboxylase biotin carboxyl carrier protein subunit [Chloroflexi bacterium AL-N5]NOK79994.1 acetyl-CoA carboxylase biotin carboxyl carrier protein subunit [Chloroflexi bacterium AL-W]NOK88150.1 acetyl-CoA carboxylase biotin carboxyl carrier protein subunit [Chloroflexi bacteriu
MSKVQVTIDDQAYEIEVNPQQRTGDELMIIVNGESVPVTVPGIDDHTPLDWLVVDGQSYEIALDDDLRWIGDTKGLYRLTIRDMDVAVARPPSGDGRVKAPIPGLIARLLVEEGSQVEAGQPIIILEAMKMENQIRAPRSGTVSQIEVREGQVVILDQLMIEIT